MDNIDVQSKGPEHEEVLFTDVPINRTKKRFIVVTIEQIKKLV